MTSLECIGVSKSQPGPPADSENSPPKNSQEGRGGKNEGSSVPRQQVAGTLSSAAPATTHIVKMSRREGWAKFIAYEVMFFE